MGLRFIKVGREVGIIIQPKFLFGGHEHISCHFNYTSLLGKYFYHSNNKQGVYK